MATPSTAQEARSRARRLEGSLDSKLAQLSRSSQDDRGGAGLVREIEVLLQDLEQANDQMSREAMDGPGGTATAMHKLQRHREQQPPQPVALQDLLHGQLEPWRPYICLERELQSGIGKYWLAVE